MIRMALADPRCGVSHLGAVAKPSGSNGGTPATTLPCPRFRTTAPAIDTEALIRGVVSRIQSQGSAEADRLRDAVRKAIALLQTAVG